MLKILRQLICWHDYEWHLFAEPSMERAYFRCDCKKCGKRIVLAPVEMEGGA